MAKLIRPTEHQEVVEQAREVEGEEGEGEVVVDCIEDNASPMASSSGLLPMVIPAARGMAPRAPWIAAASASHSALAEA